MTELRWETLLARCLPYTDPVRMYKVRRDVHIVFISYLTIDPSSSVLVFDGVLILCIFMISLYLMIADSMGSVIRDEHTGHVPVSLCQLALIEVSIGIVHSINIFLITGFNWQREHKMHCFVQTTITVSSKQQHNLQAALCAIL